MEQRFSFTKEGGTAKKIYWNVSEAFFHIEEKGVTSRLPIDA